MVRSNRRAFLVEVGRGMLIAEVGLASAVDLGLTSARAADVPAGDGERRLTFGACEKLVAQIQETPPDKILSFATQRLKEGTTLKELVGAAALANARAFGGEDYTGFHTFMALAPSLFMAGQLSGSRQPLPVLKVLHRNARRLAEWGGPAREVLKPVELRIPTANRSGAEAIRDAVHRRDAAEAEQAFAASANVSPEQAFNDLLHTVQESADVHRVVLAHRAWDMREVAGQDYAAALLRQSLRYCVKNEKYTAEHMAGPRGVLPKLFDQHKLSGRALGTRVADDDWVDKMSQSLFTATADQAADMAAAALAEGFSIESVGEAISLAANQLVLRDSGRTGRQVQPGKPEGSVHGDSIGVHACDAVHAWRAIARAASTRNALASVILAGYHAAQDRVARGGKFLEWKPRPYAEDLAKIAAKDEAGLLKELDAAIREQNQSRACAIVHRYGEVGGSPRPVLDVLLRYATSEDGALHAEKYFRTVSEEFAQTRSAFRGRQLVALARVTASEFGQPAPGYDEACRLLNV